MTAGDEYPRLTDDRIAEIIDSRGALVSETEYLAREVQRLRAALAAAGSGREETIEECAEHLEVAARSMSSFATIEAFNHAAYILRALAGKE